MSYFHAPWISMDRWSYILWDMVRSERAWWISMPPGYPHTVDSHGHVEIHSLGQGYGRACMVDNHAPWISIHCGYSWTDVDTFSGIGLRPSMHGGYSCTLDIQTQWIFRIFMDRWRYIIWDRLGPSMNCGYPCTGGEIYTIQQIGDTLSVIHVGYVRICGGGGGYTFIFIINPLLLLLFTKTFRNHDRSQFIIF